MNIRTDVFGWFTADNPHVPAHDPTVDGGICPVCSKPLSRPVVTTSLMKDGDDKSYFFRCHKVCHSSMGEEEMGLLESSLIDAL